MHPDDCDRAVAGGMVRWSDGDYDRQCMDVVRVCADPYFPMEPGEIKILTFPLISRFKLTFLGLSAVKLS